MLYVGVAVFYTGSPIHLNKLCLWRQNIMVVTESSQRFIYQTFFWMLILLLGFSHEQRQLSLPLRADLLVYWLRTYPLHTSCVTLDNLPHHSVF